MSKLIKITAEDEGSLRAFLRGGGGGIYYNGLYGEVSPEGVPFYRRQVYERMGISLVEVHERVEKSVISVFKKDQES